MSQVCMTASTDDLLAAELTGDIARCHDGQMVVRFREKTAIHASGPLDYRTGKRIADLNSED